MIILDWRYFCRRYLFDAYAEIALFLQKMILQNRHIRYSTVCLTNGAHLPAPSKSALGKNKAFWQHKGVLV